MKALAAIDRGIPRREVAGLFGVSRSTIKRWLGRRRLTGDVNIHKIPGRPSVKGKALREWLPGHLKTNPDLALKEHCETFEDEMGVEVSEATMSRNIARLPGEWPLKKSALSLFVPGGVAAAGRGRVVLLALEVLGDPVARYHQPPCFQQPADLRRSRCSAPPFGRRWRSAAHHH